MSFDLPALFSRGGAALLPPCVYMHADVRSPDDVIAFSPDDDIAFSPDDVIAFLTGPFSKLVIKDSKTMFMMRSGQVPLRTKDGGATWTPLTSAAPLFKYGATFDLDISWSGKTIVMHGGDLSAIARQEYANQYIDWFSPIICSRTLMGGTPTPLHPPGKVGGGAPHPCSLGVAACYFNFC